MIEKYIEYAKGLNANQEVIDWINTTLLAYVKKRQEPIDPIDHEHIIDWLISSSSPTRLRKLSYNDAKRLSDEWSKSNQKKGKHLIDKDDDIEMVHDFLDGNKIVKLKTKKAYQREGYLMNHCLGGYDIKNDVEIYSYRDSQNLPHATFEVRKDNNKIMQVKGKGNGDIYPKYINPILTFLKVIGMDIRPSEMKNLGYYHIDEVHIDFLKKTNAWKQVCEINGEHYAF